MTRRQEMRLLWCIACLCGCVLVALPVLMPVRYPLADIALGILLLAAGSWRLWRRRRRRAINLLLEAER